MLNNFYNHCSEKLYALEILQNGSPGIRELLFAVSVKSHPNWLSYKQSWLETEYLFHGKFSHFKIRWGPNWNKMSNISVKWKCYKRFVWVFPFSFFKHKQNNLWLWSRTRSPRVPTMDDEQEEENIIIKVGEELKAGGPSPSWY